MTSDARIEIIEIAEARGFELIPPCADPRFDHRSCDYWEDEGRGSKAARPGWWQAATPAPEPRPAPAADNPFAAAPGGGPAFNPFDPANATDRPAPLGQLSAAPEPGFNPFAPEPALVSAVSVSDPRKLRLLDRGRRVFGSYAKVLLRDGAPAAYVQFGPLSAYPRAQRLRELYPHLPTSPLPAVITCIASVGAAQGEGLAQRLIADIVADLAARGFAAVEAYPDLTLGPDEASAATPAFWQACGFTLAVADDRFPVMRRALE